VFELDILGSNPIVVFVSEPTKLSLQENSDWIYIMPWGLYKAVTYVKEKYDKHFLCDMLLLLPGGRGVFTCQQKSSVITYTVKFLVGKHVIYSV
jgi:hypothetical protein